METPHYPGRFFVKSYPLFKIVRGTVCSPMIVYGPYGAFERKCSTFHQNPVGAIVCPVVLLSVQQVPHLHLPKNLLVLFTRKKESVFTSEDSWYALGTWLAIPYICLFWQVVRPLRFMWSSTYFIHVYHVPGFPIPPPPLTPHTKTGKLKHCSLQTAFSSTKLASTSVALRLILFNDCKALTFRLFNRAAIISLIAQVSEAKNGQTPRPPRCFLAVSHRKLEALTLRNMATWVVTEMTWREPSFGTHFIPMGALVPFLETWARSSLFSATYFHVWAKILIQHNRSNRKYHPLVLTLLNESCLALAANDFPAVAKPSAPKVNDRVSSSPQSCLWTLIFGLKLKSATDDLAMSLPLLLDPTSTSSSFSTTLARERPTFASPSTLPLVLLTAAYGFYDTEYLSISARCVLPDPSGLSFSCDSWWVCFLVFSLVTILVFLQCIFSFWPLFRSETLLLYLCRDSLVYLFLSSFFGLG